jgi:hypothetical protein
MAQAKQKGDLESYLAIKAEEKRVLDGGLVDEGTTNSIESVAANAKKIVAERENRIAVQLRQYISQLESLLKQSMLSDKIDEAKVVKEVLDQAKVELAGFENSRPNRPPIPSPTIQPTEGKQLVIWNSHNSHFNDRGTLVCDINLFNGSTKVWGKKDIQVPWLPNTDTNVSLRLPVTSRFNKVRIEITKWVGLGAGLAEIELLDGDQNIAKGCFVSASGYYFNNGNFSSSFLTDGKTSSEGDTFFWLGREGTREWIEVDLTKKIAPQADSSELGVPDSESEEVEAEQKPVSAGQKSIPKESTTYNGHHYLAVLERKSWHEAKKACENMGGHLAIITSKGENDFVSSLEPNHYVWIGLSDEKKNREFRWVNDKKAIFLSWRSGNPDNMGGSEHYVELRGNDKSWNDCPDNSGHIAGYICEWDK